MGMAVQCTVLLYTVLILAPVLPARVRSDPGNGHPLNWWYGVGFAAKWALIPKYRP